MKRIFLLLITSILFCGIAISSNTDFVIVIDPGHGGKDPGALRGLIKEKDINLGVATELGKLIEKSMSDVKVVHTRKTDVFVALEKRSEIANKAKANLFISIHTNSTEAKTTSASGADTYILGLARSAENLAVAKRENAVIKYEQDYSTKYEGFDPDSPESYIIFEFMTNQYMQQSLDIASYIQKDFKDVAKRVDRGVRQAGFLVLRESSMPSILIELGFINNPTEAKFLASPEGQRKMASAIYSGFRQYKIEFDKKQGYISNYKEPERVIASVQQAARPQTVQPAKQSEIQPSASIAQAGETEYRVQFLYSTYKVPEGSSQFKGVIPTGYTIDNGYKYTYGATTDYNEALRLQAEVRKKVKDAFIVSIPAGQTVASAVTPSVNSARTTTQSAPAKTIAPLGQIEYRVQFLISPSRLQDNSPRFQGLEGVLFYQDGGYKYTVGSTTDYNEIRRLHNQVKLKFKDSFIIRMKDGKRIK